MDAYTDLQAAELYDVLNPWSCSDAFFLDWVMECGRTSAIDIGCGTGCGKLGIPASWSGSIPIRAC
ncbi:MAG: hypothetical protein QM589_13200 [Thermomicrobiales bacterium]